MKRQFSAGIVVYHHMKPEINYLLLHYPGGHWDFPKGKIEEGEQKEQAARRELQEETGIDKVEILPGFENFIEYYLYIDSEICFKNVTFFLGEVDKTSIVISEEHLGYEWLNYEEAHERITYQNSKDVLERAHQFLKNFNYNLC